MAKPIPVFPEVPSIIVPPGFNKPAFSASSTIFKAIRSLMEFPGLKYSTLTSTVALMPEVILLSFTIGVFPMASMMELKYINLCFKSIYTDDSWPIYFE